MGFVAVVAGTVLGYDDCYDSGTYPHDFWHSRNYATVLGAISAVCRKQAAVSHIVLTKISKKFVLFGMLPYLCIVNQTKQVLGDAKQEN